MISFKLQKEGIGYFLHSAHESSRDSTRHILREEVGPTGAYSTRMSAFPVTLLEVGSWLHRQLGLWYSFGTSSSGSWYRSHKAHRAVWANLKSKLESERSEGPDKEMHERVFGTYPHLKGVKQILVYVSETLQLHVFIIRNCHVQ